VLTGLYNIKVKTQGENAKPKAKLVDPVELKFILSNTAIKIKEN
jgi:hypothetical protein